MTSPRCSATPSAFGRAVDDLVTCFHDVAVDRVVGVESRGFILAAPVAYRLRAGFVPVRKAGKLPWAVAREEYELEYGTDKLEIHRDAIHPSERILVVDDVLATGGTAAATGRLIETLGGIIVGFGFLIEIADLNGRCAPRGAPRRKPGHATDGDVMSTVDRVLPWRRHHEAAASAELTPLLAVYRRRHPKARVDMINRAYHMAAEAHRSQTRSSGESYINHPLAVATIVADIGLDDVSVAAALLHDAVEDTEITLPDVEEHFGAEVARLVDGVTKLERIQFDSREAQQAATMRKMLVAMAKDLRVLVIKLADRLHNMRTIAGMPPEKQQRIAQETLDIYAPLAHRLGIQEIKQQLEDLSFAACTRSATPSSTTSSPRAHPSARCSWPRRWPRSAAA